MEELKENVTQEETQKQDDRTEIVDVRDYKVILDMIKEVDDQYNMISDVLIRHIQSEYGLNKETIDDILFITEEKIQEMDEDEIRQFLENHIDHKHAIFAYTGTFKTDKDVRKIMMDVKEKSLTLLNAKRECQKMKEESNDILKDYFNYLSSDTAKENRLKRIAVLKESLDNETDPSKKKKMEKMISDMEAASDLSFVHERFEKFGEKEVESIKTAYFDRIRGSYIIDKYNSKMKSFGFDAKLYTYFFNLEENFLPEEYHPFNNLFLFIYMRMVAYADKSNKRDVMFIQSLTSTMANLIYHKFNSSELEQGFIDIIKLVDDHFMKYKEYFEKNNETYEKHPARIHAAQVRETHRKELLCRKMFELGITGYDMDWTADQLQEYLNQETDHMIDDQLNTFKQKKEEPTDEAETEEAETVALDDIKAIDADGNVNPEKMVLINSTEE